MTITKKRQVSCTCDADTQPGICELSQGLSFMIDIVIHVDLNDLYSYTN